MTLMLVGPSLMEVWTDGGLLDLIENTPENYAKWVACCCGDCCPCGLLVHEMLGAADPTTWALSVTCETLGGCFSTTRTNKDHFVIESGDCSSFSITLQVNQVPFNEYVQELSCQFRCVGDSAEFYDLIAQMEGASCVALVNEATTYSVICTECRFEYVIHVPIYDEPGVCACSGDTLVIKFVFEKLIAPCV